MKYIRNTEAGNQAPLKGTKKRYKKPAGLLLENRKEPIIREAGIYYKGNRNLL